MEYRAPIMSCAEAAEFERRFFARGEFGEREAIRRAGRGIAAEFLREFDIGSSPRIIAIAGCGHNGADALAAAAEICRRIPGASVCAATAPREKLKPATALELDALLSGGAKIEKAIPLSELPNIRGKFDLVIEGLAGMSFRPPARAELCAAIGAANALDARIKISADMPAGVSADAPRSPAFRADATYAAGIAKDALFKPFNRPLAGRIRLVDIGFFRAGAPDCAKGIVLPAISGPLKALRPALSDKRSYGHAFILAGSRRYPGAALMNVRAALRAGAGLVTAFVPETFAAQFAAAEPSAIWVGCPEDGEGAVALESYGLVRPLLPRASAFLAGSGMTGSAETAALTAQILKDFPEIPAVLDADAVSESAASLLRGRRAPSLLTPHEGEFLRIAPDASDGSLTEAAERFGCAILLKSSATRACEGGRITYSVRGGPALSRAGSGDLLAGLCCSLAASKKFTSASLAALCASDWLGRASELAARDLTETAMASSDIVAYLPRALADLA